VLDLARLDHAEALGLNILVVSRREDVGAPTCTCRRRARRRCPRYWPGWRPTASVLVLSMSVVVCFLPSVSIPPPPNRPLFLSSSGTWQGLTEGPVEHWTEHAKSAELQGQAHLQRR
jgi:hypothetical protein